MRTVLFVGAGRHQRRAILRAKELGLRVAAVDRNPAAPGLAEADIAKVVDVSDVGAVLKAIARLRIDGVLTVAADRAVRDCRRGRRSPSACQGSEPKQRT